ncbi:MAG: FecR family protein, partial [Acidobacteriota bacterium]
MRPQVILGLLLLCLPAAARAQDPGLGPDPDASADGPPPITVVYVEGRVDTAREGGGVQATRVPDLLDDADRLVTADGRAELAYPDGSVVHLDRNTETRVDAGGRLRLVRGRIAVHTPRDADPIELATPVGVLRLESDGEYDVAASDLDGDTVMTAVRGRAALEDGGRSLPISADDELRLAPRDREPRWARAAAADAFSRWARSRVATTVRIARDYDLPPSLAPYGPQLSQYGQWTSLPPYGPVWQPAAPAGWRPYTNGSWRYTRYGWTWIDSDPWGWPVHHYGRWGRHDTRGWYWIPQRAWAPAWVGWAIAADHVAWSPLGWDRRPLVDFFVGARGGPSDEWASSWSILPRQSFGARGPVFRQLEDPRRLAGPVLGGFVSQMVGPRGPAGAGDRYAPRPGRRPYTQPAAPTRERQWSAPARRDPPGP